MRRTKEDAEKTRCAILRSAELLFLERGVAHTSLDIIARHAGVTRGAVYWHFANKAHLFHEMLNQVRLPLEHIAALLARDNACDSLQALRNLCIEAIESLVLDEHKQRVLTILLHRCEFTEELREAEDHHNSFIDQFLLLTADLLRQEQCARYLQPGFTPELAARALHAMLLGFFGDWLRDRRMFDPLRDSQALVDGMFRAVLRDWNPAQHCAGERSG